jgi:hypothetical protein
MSDPASLYEQDFVRWSEDQAGALREAARSGANLPLDWENLAEEIDDLGRSLRRELRSRVGTIAEHLFKLEFSSRVEPRRGWIETVTRERAAIQELLDENPSLKPDFPALVNWRQRHVAELAAETLALYDEGEQAAKLLRAARRYTSEEVLGRWFPEPYTGS